MFLVVIFFLLILIMEIFYNYKKDIRYINGLRFWWYFKDLVEKYFYNYCKNFKICLVLIVLEMLLCRL